MTIKTLAENTAKTPSFKSEHGLCLYIEANGRKILLDTGKSALFLENAKKLRVKIKDIDYLVISHGHYDHGGGMNAFFEINDKAEAFIRPTAFNGHYSLRDLGETTYIGLDKTQRENRRIIYTTERFAIAKGIWTFSGVAQTHPLSAANSNLYAEKGGEKVLDAFEHEQNLVIEEGGRSYLFTGCAHNGIINIIEHFRAIKGKTPTYVIGGFHLFSPSGGMESESEIDETGRYLMKTNALCYTCHCTGAEPYERLKKIMGEKLGYLHAGSMVAI